jgi:hypothetical protein
MKKQEVVKTAQYSNRLTFSIPSNLYEKLRKKSEKSKVSISTIIRSIVDERGYRILKASKSKKQSNSMVDMKKDYTVSLTDHQYNDLVYMAQTEKLSKAEILRSTIALSFKRSKK